MRLKGYASFQPHFASIPMFIRNFMPFPIGNEFRTLCVFINHNNTPNQQKVNVKSKKGERKIHNTKITT